MRTPPPPTHSAYVAIGSRHVSLFAASLQVALPQKGLRDQLSLMSNSLHWVEAKHLVRKSEKKK